MKIIRTEYEVEGNRPVVYAFYRDDNGRKIIKDDCLLPYFYVPYEEKDKIGPVESDKYKSIYGEDLARIYVNLPSDVPIMRDNFSKHYEADVVFPIRYLIDRVDTFEPAYPSTMFIDIETDNSGRVPDPGLAEEPILCISAFSNDVYTTFVYREDLSTGNSSREFNDTLQEIEYFRTEREMLQSFINYCESEEPDVITGWNFIAFDLPYIINRAKKLGIDYSALSPMRKVYEGKYGITVKGVAVIDLMASYKHFTQTKGMKESYSLDNIGKAVLGIGKANSSSNIKWLWKYDLDNLIHYNVQDVMLCVEIDRSERLIEFMNELRILCYCQLEDTLTVTRMLDSYVLKLYHNRLVFPSKEHHDVKHYKGAIVELNTEGLHRNVAVFDLSSLYPSIIVSANLSPESIENNNSSLVIGNHKVRQDIRGYLPETVKTLFSERKRFKDLRNKEEYESDRYKFYDMRQTAMKIILNSIYGQTAYPNSRLYDARVAETITWVGREIITWSKDYIEDIGYKVLYIDTDSLHVEFDEINLENMKNVLGLINCSYDEFAGKLGLKNHIFNMDFEKIYSKVFYGQGTKKRYAGALCYKDGKTVDILDVWGFETKRSDASTFTKEMLKNVFDMVLRQDKPKDQILKYIGDEIDRIRKGDFSFEEIGIPKGMSKDPMEYFKQSYDSNSSPWRQKGISANIRGALYSIKHLNIELSNKPKMIYINKMPNGFEPIDVICFDTEKQVPPGVQIDTEKMLDRLVKTKVEPLFNGLGWKISELSLFWRGKAPKEGIQEKLL